MKESSIAVHSELDHSSQVFRNLALRYSEIGAKEKTRIIPFLDSRMPLFHKASFEEQEKAIKSLKIILEIHEEAILAGNGSIKSNQLIWRALKKFSLVPGPDVFERIKDEDTVLIYNEGQTVLFWNLEFFNFTNLTIEQLLFEKWHNFTERQPEIEKLIHNLVHDIITGRITGNFDANIPGHEVKEIGTFFPISTWMEIPWGSVLTNKGTLGGILLVQRMKILS